MAKPFSFGEVHRLVEKHQDYISKIAAGAAEFATYRKEVEAAAGRLAMQQSDSILKTIPIEELNRDKSGIRVKLLRENKIETLADLHKKRPSDLSCIYGISADGARLIFSKFNEILNTVKDEVHIRLSADDRSPAMVGLVKAVDKYLLSREVAVECKKLLDENGQTLSKAIQDIEPATGALKWMFSSAEKKEKATEAYFILTEMLEGGYADAAKKIAKKMNAIMTLPVHVAWKDFTDQPVLVTNTLEEIVPGLLGNDDTLYGLPEELAHEIQKEEFSESGLRCTLRRYQEWGVRYILHQRNVLLGDEMGLGKTVQAIAAMVSLWNAGGRHFLVICPAGILTNWCREIEKMSTLPFTEIHGWDRDDELNLWLSQGGVGVTTYETVGKLDIPSELELSMLVADEAHYIKNPSAQRTKHVKALTKRAERKLFMTGTALENRVDEMVFLIRMLNPEVAKLISGMEFLSSAPQFREKVAPVYYRRKREDVLTELPELTETCEWCTMNAVEELVYERTVLEERYMDCRQVSWNVADMRDSSKARRMMEIIEEAEGDGRKVLVFSFFLNTINRVVELLADRCMEPITGAVSPARRQEIIDEYEKAPAGTVLVAQIQAGGTGLNIQSASVVIICEPQLKPSTENQAVSRAYRMGQTRNVLVFRLLSENSVDERMIEILAGKQEIFDAFADESVAGKRDIREDDENAVKIGENAEALVGTGAESPESAETGAAKGDCAKTASAGSTGTNTQSHEIEIDAQSFHDIMKSEYRRITEKNAKREAAGLPQAELPEETDKEE